MAHCLIALGSNLGDRAVVLDRALELLASSRHVRVIARSAWYATQPVGGPSGQESFLNGAALLDTTLTASEVWKLLSETEFQLGRRRAERWGPRSIDLDLLLYDDLVLRTADLEIPHPRMAVRRFVLAPAAEIAAEWRHPRIGWTLARLLSHLDSRPNYVALTGTRQVTVREAARSAAAEVDGRLLSDSAPAGDDFVACVARRAALLSAEVWRDERRVIVSDFWFGELEVVALDCADRARRESLLGAWRAAARDVVAPKLLVLVREPRDASASAEALEAAALRPGQGPVLALDAGNPSNVVEEIVAAVRAMA